MRKMYKITTNIIACENSRPSSLPARVAFHATRAGSEEGRLFSQATNIREVREGNEARLCTSNLVPRAHAPFGQHQDTEIYSVSWC